MGLLRWLFPGPPRVAEADHVWLTAAAKLAGLAADLRAADGPVLLLAHFPATLAAVRAGWSHTPMPARLTAAEAERLPAGVHTGLAAQLVPPSADGLPPADGESPAVVVAERHFLRAADDFVVAFAGGFRTRGRVDFHTALDDPLMTLFGGPRVQQVAKWLGSDERTPLDSAMLVRQVAKAQAHVAEACPAADWEAESAADWLARYGPAGRA